ncbi:hypothetical protein PIB30_084366 [Stylosanthes scabra]|uniref:Uncharacterized protein n=1 Tax=Stylosanthes scabra TaxID=79078 RepID=A0ABU6SSQ9_9FABA|nr:hypothetical protein [Stylosanthes scabra]
MTKSSKRQQHNKQKKQTKAKLEKLCQIRKRSSSQVNPRNGKCSPRESERVNKREIEAQKMKKDPGTSRSTPLFHVIREKLKILDRASTLYVGHSRIT